jgi:hypothetical protein
MLGPGAMRMAKRVGRWKRTMRVPSTIVSARRKFGAAINER